MSHPTIDSKHFTEDQLLEIVLVFGIRPHTYTTDIDWGWSVIHKWLRSRHPDMFPDVKYPKSDSLQMAMLEEIHSYLQGCRANE